jgi:MarR family transcriptional regulator, organic hydroperoxide resistance regulator
LLPVAWRGVRQEPRAAVAILKKLEEMGYVHRERALADERQVVVSLTDSGCKLREKAATGGNLMGATGLTPEEFRTLQKAVVRLRDNLVESMKG